MPLRQLKLDPVPLRPDQTLQAIGATEHVFIGRVVSEWTYLENCLGELLLKCTGMSFEDGRLFTARMDPARLIELLRTLGPRKLQGQHLQILIDLLTISDQLRDDRNFIFHGTWAIMMPEHVPTVSSLRTKSNPDVIVTENFPHICLVFIISPTMAARPPEMIEAGVNAIGPSDLIDAWEGYLGKAELVSQIYRQMAKSRCSRNFHFGGFYRCVSPWWHLLHRLRRADGYGHLPAITKTSPIVANFGGGK